MKNRYSFNPYKKFLNCIYSENITRNMLLQYPTFEEFNSLFKLQFDKHLKNFQTINTTLRSLGLSDNFRPENIPKKCITFNFEIKINKQIFLFELQENFLTILMKKHHWRENYREAYLLIHSPQNHILINNKFNKQDMEITVLEFSKLVFINKNVRMNLGYPYGKCSYYKPYNSPLNSISQSDCLDRKSVV